MRKFDKVCMYIFFTMGIFGMFLAYHTDAQSKDTRDYQYEAYCDSVFNADPDYYLDVLCTTDEYQDYIEEHGEWWGE